jgi:hypothetical protein
MPANPIRPSAANFLNGRLVLANLHPQVQAKQFFRSDGELVIAASSYEHMSKRIHAVSQLRANRRLIHQSPRRLRHERLTGPLSPVPRPLSPRLVQAERQHRESGHNSSQPRQAAKSLLHVSVVPILPKNRRIEGRTYT